MQPVSSSILAYPHCQLCKAELLAPVSDMKRMKRRERVTRPCNFGAKTTLGFAPLPSQDLSPSFTDADVEGGDGPSLAETNLDLKPVVTGGGGYGLHFLSFCLSLPAYPVTPRPNRPAASGRGAVLPARVI